MHTLLGLSSIVLVTLGSYLTLGMLHRVGPWSQRRDVQCFVLAVPILSLVLGLGGLHHFSGRPCLSRAPSWDGLLEISRRSPMRWQSDWVSSDFGSCCAPLIDRWRSPMGCSDRPCCSRPGW